MNPPMAHMTCFFCQNLLSDFCEGILPASRHEQIKSHLHDCTVCSALERKLTAALELLGKVPTNDLSPDMSLRITEASQSAGRSLWRSKTAWLGAGAAALSLLLMTVMILRYTTHLPWLSRWGGSDSDQFARFYPLINGASNIIEEQAGWLHLREPTMRSLWEEGGLSPEEFEKTFQFKNVPKGEEP